MTNYLLSRPHKLISLTFFADRYESAKSSISEDLTIVKRTFAQWGIGVIETIPGAAGGVIFTPSISEQEARTFIAEMTDRLSEESRLLPGGYVYLSDLLGQPEVLQRVGRLIAGSTLTRRSMR